MKKSDKPQLTHEMALEIIARVSEGELASKVCKEYGVNWGWFYQFVRKDELLTSMYRNAREQQYRKLGDELLELADEMPLTDPQTGKLDAAAVSWQKNRLDARKWLLSKVLPKEYGEKLEVDNKGEVGLTVKVVKFADKDDDNEK